MPNDGADQAGRKAARDWAFGEQRTTDFPKWTRILVTAQAPGKALVPNWRRWSVWG